MLLLGLNELIEVKPVVSSQKIFVITVVRRASAVECPSMSATLPKPGLIFFTSEILQ